ncbi:ketopantoate reductase family protein [Shewanella sp. YLB-07]|uniref:ketopantoate reductase family protein n=1 Tax=Shewanella sp. YLB-07 TaxID=2601268 RepID=UPI00128CF32D|nr:ketopantoate reductase C-terminal domain-containing protein [Shewanella sp. YLB-07]MPY23835.1 hypothetical protein [Shewanella sp. YLB-07]
MIKITVIGVGSLGGFVTAKLIEAGYPVQLMVSANSRLLELSQLHVIGKEPFQVPYQNIISNSQHISGDIIFITIKAVSNPLLFASLSHLKNKKLILLQNGIGEEEQLAEAIDDSNKVLGAISHIKVTMHADNKIEVQNDQLDFIYADLNGTESDPSLETVIREVFPQVEHRPDIYQVRFPKLMVNAACNAPSVIYNLSMYELTQASIAKEMIHLLAKEVRQVAKVYGVYLEKKNMDDILDMLACEDYRPAYFSMKLDYDGKRPMEIEAVYTNLLHMAKIRNIATPELVRVTHILQTQFLHE